jgi:hypothetical protein
MSQLTAFEKQSSLEASDPGEPESFLPLGPGLNVLMVWPRFPSSFGSFDGVMDLVPVETDQPPLGLLTVAALCPKSWVLRLIDRSFEDLLDEDICWADLVMVSGMRVQNDEFCLGLGLSENGRSLAVPSRAVKAFG